NGLDTGADVSSHCDRVTTRCDRVSPAEGHADVRPPVLEAGQETQCEQVPRVARREVVVFGIHVVPPEVTADADVAGVSDETAADVAAKVSLAACERIRGVESHEIRAHVEDAHPG